MVNGLNSGVSTVCLVRSSGEGSSEKNCGWWLKFQQPEQKSSSESSEWCLSATGGKSGPLKVIGQFSHDGIGSTLH